MKIKLVFLFLIGFFSNCYTSGLDDRKSQNTYSPDAYQEGDRSSLTTKEVRKQRQMSSIHMNQAREQMWDVQQLDIDEAQSFNSVDLASQEAENQQSSSQSSSGFKKAMMNYVATLEDESPLKISRSIFDPNIPEALRIQMLNTAADDAKKETVRRHKEIARDNKKSFSCWWCCSNAGVVDPAQQEE